MQPLPGQQLPERHLQDVSCDHLQFVGRRPAPPLPEEVDETRVDFNGDDSSGGPQEMTGEPAGSRSDFEGGIVFGQSRETDDSPAVVIAEEVLAPGFHGAYFFRQ